MFQLWPHHGTFSVSFLFQYICWFYFQSSACFDIIYSCHPLSVFSSYSDIVPCLIFFLFKESLNDVHSMSYISWHLTRYFTYIYRGTFLFISVLLFFFSMRLLPFLSVHLVLTTHFRRLNSSFQFFSQYVFSFLL